MKKTFVLHKILKYISGKINNFSFFEENIIEGYLGIMTVHNSSLVIQLIQTLHAKIRQLSKYEFTHIKSNY